MRNSREIASKSYPHPYEASKSVDKIKNTGNQALVQPADRSTMISQTNKIQSDAGSERRVLESTRADNERAVIERVQQILSKSTAVAKEQIAADMRRREAAHEIYDEMVNRQLDLRFTNDLQLKELVVEMVRKGSGDVVYQFPPEEALKLEKLSKYFPGIYLNQLV